MEIVKNGSNVVFTDALGTEHEALVTAVWGQGDGTPAINIVFVSADESRTDQYGRQLERFTSVVHRSMQSAHGMFWRRKSE